jgi:hypothetical protein
VPKDSAVWYSRVVRTNQVEPDPASPPGAAAGSAPGGGQAR